jgi:DUF1680 family protein
MRITLALLVSLLSINSMAQRTRPSTMANLQAVPFTSVRVEPTSFWGARIETMRQATLPHNLRECEQTGRIANFDRAARGETGEFKGFFFNDSDTYKVLEGAAYLLSLQRDAELEKTCDAIIARIAAAQRPDGYLYTYYMIRGEMDKRWSKEKDMHETYCAGHLIEAAVAYQQATGKRNLLDVAIKLADHIDGVFGPGKKHDPPGHEEIELALVKLWHATGNDKYLKLAEFFIDQRGHTQGRATNHDYDQDHLPVRDQRDIAGHAVRAMYLYSGCADIAAITGDASMLDALDAVWHDVVDRKMYLTGGVGPSAKNEGFTIPYDLPNDSAYAETCASVGMALWNQRMALLHGDAKYADIVEREMYNGLLSGVSLSGDKFFYVNPLASVGKHHRQSWFDCACCPPNVLRWIPTVGGNAYGTASDGAIYVNQYNSGSATVGDVKISQETKYPWDGRVKLTMDPGASARESALRLRVPGWCDGATVTLNGKPIPDLRIDKGYARIDRMWQAGDAIELNLPMPIRRVYADPHVKADVGRVALMRGPIVYCLEGADNPNGHVRNLVLPKDAQLRAESRPDLLGGVTVIRGNALALVDDARTTQPIEFTAIPYYAWDNRTPGEMIVWLPEDPAVAEIDVRSLAAAPRAARRPATSARQPRVAHLDGHVRSGSGK